MRNFSVQDLREALASAALSPTSSLEDQRIAHDRAVAKVPLAPGVRIDPADFGGGSTEWMIPDEETSDDVILWCHGGGYGLGSPTTSRGIVSHLASLTGRRCLSLDYPLAPESPFPAAVLRVLATYRELLTRGLEARQIVVGGDSAGGGLAMGTLLALRDSQYPMPSGAVLLSPWVDLTLVTSREALAKAHVADPQVNPTVLADMALRYAGGEDARHPWASPVFASMSGIPPLLIQVGGAEALRDDGTTLAQRAIEAGGVVDLQVWPDMIHVWQAYAPGLAEGTRALEKAAEWVSNLADPLSR